MFATWMLTAMLGGVLPMPGGGSGLAPPTARSQGPEQVVATPQFRRFGVHDNLPSGAIYAVAQDHRGLIWFATVNGLARYDGVNIEVFRHRVNDPQSIPADSIYAIFIDPDDRLWLGSVANGLIRYDSRRKTFRNWKHRDGDPSSLADDEVWSIAQTPDGSLWVATDGGLDRMRAGQAGFDHVPLQGVAGKRGIVAARALLADDAGRLWIGTENGLYLREPDGTIQRVPIDPSFRGEIGKVWQIAGHAGDIRVATQGGLLQVGEDGLARPLFAEQLASRRVVSSTRDAHGYLWIGCANGLLLDTGNGHLQEMKGEPLLPGGLPGDKIWRSMLDRDGGLWLTFEDSSVAYLPPKWNGFRRFTHVPDDASSLSGVSASSILIRRDGLVVVAGENGWLDQLDSHTGQVTHLIGGVQGEVVAMTEDVDRRLWLAVAGGLKVFDHGRLNTIDLHHSGISRPMLLASDDSGSVYLAAWDEGVFRIDSRSRKITRLPFSDGSHEARLPSQLQLDRRGGRLWYASAGGLFRSNAARTRMVFISGLSHRKVVSFALSDDGIWVRTPQALEHYHLTGYHATLDRRVDTASQSFALDEANMKVDQEHHLWLFSNPGLWMFDPPSGHFRSFGPAQGLSNAQFYSATVQSTPDGMMLAPNTAGVVAFDPERLLKLDTPGQPPLLTVVGVSARRNGNRHALDQRDGAVRMQWRDRDLDVQARVASYVDPAANHYRFRLRGFDSGWVNVDHRGERDFAGLGAGTYVLEVQAAGADGVWSAPTPPLRIVVQAPPWARWWAWLVYLLITALVAVLLLRNWRRRLAQRHRLQLVEQQRQMAEAASAAKTQFLATLSHEIRTPMTGVMGMAELMLGTPLTPLQHDYTRAMQRSGGMLLKLLNDALDLARIEAGRLELEPAPFDPRQMLEDVTQLEQGLAHSKNIRFALVLVGDLPAKLIGDSVRIKQVLLNLANNALKFTEHGSVIMRASWSCPGLMLEVSDTGPGIPEASQARLFQRFEQEEGPQRRAGSGLGLAICRELVEMMGGSIELESRVGHGTTFRVRLPLVEPATPIATVDSTPVSKGALRLLLVEDDAIVAAVICGLLQRQQHVVCHVANGLAALAELAHASFDAVLLDLDLPGVDGFQIARLIRQREHAGEHLPIVAVTARSGGDDEALARAAGMDGFLRKPLSGDDLAQALAQIRHIASGVRELTEAE